VDIVTVLRMIERLLAVGFGGMSIYLGYRLFLALPEIRDANGEFRLPFDIRVVLGRVGPGAFFALFGACVVALSLYASVRYDVTAQRAPAERTNASLPAETRSFAGLGDQPGGADAADEARADARRMLRRDMTELNALESKLRADLPDPDRAEITGLLRRVKLKLLRPVWEKEWGDPAVFEDWIASGRTDPPPALAVPVELYFLGSQGRAP